MTEIPKCPHCGGWLFLDWDEDGNYLTCLNCAREYDLARKPRKPLVVSEAETTT